MKKLLLKILIIWKQYLVYKQKWYWAAKVRDWEKNVREWQHKEQEDE